MSAFGVELITAPIQKLITYVDASNYVNQTETNLSQVTLKTKQTTKLNHIDVLFSEKKYLQLKQTEHITKETEINRQDVHINCS